MVKRFSAERALELIFEEREDDDEVDEEVSEYEDHISETSESDIDFEEEDEIEHQPKRRWATGPAHQQPAPAPAHQ